MQGRLFTDYFLSDGIRATAEWRGLASSGGFEAFRDGARRRFDLARGFSEPNEAVTERELIWPVLELLGWADYLPQQGAARNEDVPDLLLFADSDAKTRAVGRGSADQRYADGVAVGESKRLGLPLDARVGSTSSRELGSTGSRELGAGRRASRTPHGQMLRYLSTAEIESDGRIRWGILTSGDVWRLYYGRARPRATGYFEADLGDVLEQDNDDALRVFYLLFRRDSFVLRDGAVTTFLESALAEGRRYEEKVAADLSGTVFERVFPSLVGALADAGGEDLPAVREAALIFLYRLLFILYAEDRGLLPVNDPRYDDYGLRKPVREDIARRMDAGAAFSTVASSYYDHLTTLCRLIDVGDPSIGLPPYNGGLFSESAAPMLGSVRLPDAIVAPLIYDLSHAEGESAGSTGSREPRRFISYRDMSVQQLGSIYERLLEREPVRQAHGSPVRQAHEGPVRGGEGGIEVRPNPYARKDSGSFFTPQELVDLIVDRTLKPLVEERLAAFENRSAELADDGRPMPERRAELLRLDPAEAALDLKVLDPAMGSGHFLVTAVDFLSDYIADLVEYAPAVPDWMEGEYVSPLVERVASIRADIVRRARQSDWIMDESQLTDQAIIRRMVLKRCIYGVDKNPLTVELAKVSLWLHSFTVGAPLSFLDHHLRCGDSLIGLSVTEATAELNRLGGLFASSAIAGAEAATAGMQRIEEMSDADVAEVRESASLFRGVENMTADVRGLLDFLCGLRWTTAGMRQRQRAEFENPLVETLGSRPDEAYGLLARGMSEPGFVGLGDGQDSGFSEIWSGAKSVADRERFLHWQVAFPGVWQGWQEASPRGGFDAVIGNPPWDRIKLQEVEWFASRRPELALAPTAAARRTGIRRMRADGDPLVEDFDDAKDRADRLGQVVRGSGHYPLLGRGDINLYSLFVERAMSLVKPDGFVGLLTPSGIYADRTAAKFFKSVSTTGRVSSILDFENRRLGTGLPPFFPDVDSRFKFCALILGGSERRFEQTECAFFMHDVETVGDPERCFPLSPDDFARVNPNTGTAPVFRTRRDAEITRRIYERHPALVDRSDGNERKAWPVRYRTMFHMTNDSHLFRTAAQLDAEGFYPVEGNRWKRGDDLYLPLYEGKMVQAFDHRAASVVINPENLNRPAQPHDATPEQHTDPNWLPKPQYWVPESECGWEGESSWIVGFKEITAPTNMRTFIAALLPTVGFGNKVPILVPEIEERKEWLLAANLNAMAFDFVTRQKIQGQTLNLFIIEQLPVIAPDDYCKKFGDTTAREIVRDHVLRLTYTAHDMRPFARDLGCDGEPFRWDAEERRHLRARLDALYFHLYGLSREDAAYVLDTFPIVRRQDVSAFGRYRTRDMALAYMNALSAGDVGTRVAV